MSSDTLDVIKLDDGPNEINGTNDISNGRINPNSCSFSPDFYSGHSSEEVRVLVGASKDTLETSKDRIIELEPKAKEVYYTDPSARTSQESMEYCVLRDCAEYSKSILYNNPCMVHPAVDPGMHDLGYGNLPERLDDNVYLKFNSNADCRKHIDTEDNWG